MDSVPLVAQLLGVEGDGQPPIEQPAEGGEEDLPLIGGECPPDRVARAWDGRRHWARGGTAPLSRRSMAVLLQVIASVSASRPAIAGPTRRRPHPRSLPDRTRLQLHSVAGSWKFSWTVWPNQKAQMAVYFLLIKDQPNARPPHGFIVRDDGSRHCVENGDDLKAWVLDLAGQIRAARKAVTDPTTINPRRCQCRACGQRGNCGRARL